jgi:hypothetical protein
MPASPPIRPESGSSNSDDRTQFTLDIARVRSGAETRTTLMIRNIPNKYTQKMLLATVDDTHKGLYDFFYLPIDFKVSYFFKILYFIYLFEFINFWILLNVKNKCNVGYAFINFIETSPIPSFYQKLHHSKWDRFNSEKVCEISYARIQGKDALINHFQNSSLMGEDKKCRPIIFHSDGPNMGQQAPFPVGSNVRARKDEKPRVGSPGTRKIAKDDSRAAAAVSKNPRLRSYSSKV